MKNKKYTPKDIDESKSSIQDAAVSYSPHFLRVLRPGLSLTSVDEARQGVTIKEFTTLASKMGLTQTEMSMILNISLRTLQRYSDHFVLDADSSSKVLQLKAMNERGIEIFNNQLSFNKWLKSPVRELEGETPLSYLDTALGFYILDQILGRIEHGIFA